MRKEENKIEVGIDFGYIEPMYFKECKFCGRQVELRFGGCWECANAQSILATGRDMFQDDIEGQVEIPVKIVNERLEKLISKGWKCW